MPVPFTETLSIYLVYLFNLGVKSSYKLCDKSSGTPNYFVLDSNFPDMFTLGDK